MTDSRKGVEKVFCAVIAVQLIANPQPPSKMIKKKEV